MTREAVKKTLDQQLELLAEASKKRVVNSFTVEMTYAMMAITNSEVYRDLLRTEKQSEPSTCMEGVKIKPGNIFLDGNDLGRYVVPEAESLEPYFVHETKDELKLSSESIKSRSD